MVTGPLWGVWCLHGAEAIDFPLQYISFLIDILPWDWAVVYHIKTINITAHSMRRKKHCAPTPTLMHWKPLQAHTRENLLSLHPAALREIFTHDKSHSGDFYFILFFCDNMSDSTGMRFSCGCLHFQQTLRADVLPQMANQHGTNPVFAWKCCCAAPAPNLPFHIVLKLLYKNESLPLSPQLPVHCVVRSRISCLLQPDVVHLNIHPYVK